MPAIEITASGPQLPDGTYEMQLSAIQGDPDDPEKPRSVTAEKGAYAGQTFLRWDWIFHTDDEQEWRYGTSTATGPKSKMGPLLSALLGGRRLQVGEKIDFTQLVGRRVYGTIQRDPESGYCDIVGFSAMPTKALQQGFAKQTGAPIQPEGSPAPVAAAQPLREQVGTALPNQQVDDLDDLPF
jgi:hypothetical protein